MGVLVEAEPAGAPHTPYVEGHLVREKVSRQDNFTQAGERYRAFEDWERDELISNLVSGLYPCTDDIRQRMIEMFKQCDAEYGRRVEEGLKMMDEKMSSQNGSSNGEADGALNGSTAKAEEAKSAS